MAKELLTAQKATREGVNPTYQSVTTLDGFRFLNDGHTILWFEEKVAGGDVTITFTSTKTVDGAATVARSVTLPSGGKRILGPFPPDQYNDADGYLNMTISSNEANGVVVISVR